MGSIRTRAETGTLLIDFRFRGQRLREQTTLSDTPANRKKLGKALDRIEAEIALGSFDYEKTFGKALPTVDAKSAASEIASAAVLPQTPGFKTFANQWFDENVVQWRRSYRITQRGTIDRHLIPFFGDKPMGEFTKADVLAFRAHLANQSARGGEAVLSSRRVNAILKPLRQILNEAADRFSFTSAFRNIKPLKIKRSDVMPFSLEEVQSILQVVRPDYRNYFTVRFFTGMRTGEVHGLKWKYVDFERRLILVRESIVLGEEDDLKTEDSLRDILMTQVVFEALMEQAKSTKEISDYVFCNMSGKALDNKNFNYRVWRPLLAHLGLAYRRPYQMRHTCATLWLASGEAPEWIARQLGHSSTEMLFRVYSRYVPNLTRQDGSAMDRLLASRLSTGQVVRMDERGTALTPVGDTGLYAPAAIAQQPAKRRGMSGSATARPRQPTDITLQAKWTEGDPQPPPVFAFSRMASHSAIRLSA